MWHRFSCPVFLGRQRIYAAGLASGLGCTLFSSRPKETCLGEVWAGGGGQAQLALDLSELTNLLLTFSSEPHSLPAPGAGLGVLVSVFLVKSIHHSYRSGNLDLKNQSDTETSRQQECLEGVKSGYF